MHLASAAPLHLRCISAAPPTPPRCAQVRGVTVEPVHSSQELLELVAHGSAIRAVGHNKVHTH